MTKPQSVAPGAIRIDAEPDDATLTRPPRPGGANAELPALPSEPLVSVVMTTFNSERLVGDAIESLLIQTYSNLEVIIVDDGSTDSTRQIVALMAARDNRIKLTSFGVNRGTYWAKNFGILRSKGAVVTFMDSDDLSIPDRLEHQLAELRTPGCVVTTSLYRHVFEDGSTVERKRGAFITQMMRREVFDAVGYFDCVRTSADDEFLLRIKIVFGSAAHINVNRFLYDARVREGSLSRDPLNPKASSETGGLSPARRHYMESCRAWHASCVSAGRRPYFPFPLVRRPFDVDPLLRMEKKQVSRASNTISAVIDGRGVSSVKLQATIEDLSGVIDEFVIVGEKAELQPLKGVRWFKPLPGSADLEWLDGVSIAPGHVLVMDAAATYSPDFVSNQLMLIELLAREVLVGVSLPTGQALEWASSLWIGSLAFHTDLVASGDSETPVRLRPGSIRKARAVCAGALLPFVDFPPLSTNELRHVSFLAGAYTDKQGEESELMARARRNSIAFTGGMLSALFEADSASGKSGIAWEPSGSGSGTSAGTMGLRQQSQRIRHLLTSVAKAAKRSCGVLLQIWSLPEKLLLGCSLLFASLVFVSLAGSLGLLASAVLALSVTFFGGTLVFVARRVRIASVGLDGAVPARVRIEDEIRFARSAWMAFKNGFGSS